jgi:flagellin
MSYLLTNANALTALQNLTMTQQALSTTQNQLSTGLAVNTAADNAAYWSIAQTMTSNNGALGSVGASLKTSAAMLTTFTNALAATMSVVNLIQKDLVSAEDPTANLTQIQTDIAAQQNSLLQISNGATYNGQNWLNASVNGVNSAALQTTMGLVGGYTTDGGVQLINVQGTNINLFTNGTAATSIATASGGLLATVPATGSGALLGASAFSVTASTAQSDIQNMLTSINATISALETASATVGGAQEQITTQTSFVASMQTNLSNGVAALVDADMNQVSTRLQALQTQQQLGVQSLSIANQSSSMILKLFQ